jgi:predicted transcriptional regulator of viral defense system
MSDKLDFLKILKEIESRKLVFFKSGDVADLFGVETKSIQNYLETLANNELIIRIEKGKYCRSYLKDPWVLGSNLISGGTISYHTALAYHGLIPDSSREVYVASDRQKSNKSFFGYNFRFIKIRAHKYFGYKLEENAYGQFRVSDPEKTILDCFDLPQYSPGYKDLISIFGCMKLDENKLIEYGKQMKNLSVLKRLAFLSEHYKLEGLGRFRNTIASMLNDKYSLLDPGGAETGPFSARWKIRNNLQLSSSL